MTRNARLGLEEMPASGYISNQQLRFCLSKKELGMDEALVLRELASIDEVPDLLDIWRSSVERRRDFLSAADIDAVATALEAIYSQSVTVRIAQQGQRIMGFAAWSDTRIELLWVRHSDRHKGVGRVLLEAIVAHTPGISVHLDCQRQPAISFFGDCGFLAVDGGPELVPQRITLRHTESLPRIVAP